MLLAGDYKDFCPGGNRGGWEELKILPVPLFPSDIQTRIGQQLKEAVARARHAEHERANASTELSDLLDRENPWAIQRLMTAKPPQ